MFRCSYYPKSRPSYATKCPTMIWKEGTERRFYMHKLKQFAEQVLPCHLQCFLDNVNTNSVPDTQRCCESPPSWTTGLWPAVYESNYTLLAPHLHTKLTVLVCLAPGNSFHLYEMNVVEHLGHICQCCACVYLYCMRMCISCVFSTT